MNAHTIPASYHTVTPYLTVKDAARAIAYYEQAFGAVEQFRLTAPDDTIVHAEIKIGDSTIMLADEMPEWGNHSPQSLGGASASLALYVDDVDAQFQQAIAAGGEARQPVQDQFYGDRSGTLVDPFGHVWTLATHQEDVAPEEMQRRFEAWMAKASM